jgi:predicted regulator of Ras-like GTPase activity (Roadblock/LC7/MglB family)
VRIDLGPLTRLAGFIGAAVVDSETGLILGRVAGQSEDVDLAAAAAMEVVRAARELASDVDADDDDLEEVIVSLKGRMHLARALNANPAIIIYVALDRRAANLGMAHLTLRQAAQAANA